MAIQDQINGIIRNRQQYKDEFENKYERVKAMRDFINGIESFKHNPGWAMLIASNEKLRHEWEETVDDVDKLNQFVTTLCDGDTGCLIECLKRVKREYLNIGCIGPWRQGKSTVISKLTTLSDYVIPRSKFKTCTGTTINVFNGKQTIWEGGNYAEKDGNKAIVYYHSFHSICKLINEYLSILEFQQMPYSSTQETFIRECSDCHKKNHGKPGTDPELKKMLDTYLVNAAKYAHLLKVQDDAFDEIPNLSSKESQKRLRPLVSYYPKTDKEYEEEGVLSPEQSFDVLAVKRVDVFTDFKIAGEEVGKIQFVDTPGIGESKIGVTEALSQALRSDIDIAICLKKVSGQKGIITSDSKLFHAVLKRSTKGRKPEKWVFYLYNKEGNVPEDILMTTFTDVNDDLANTIVNGYNNESIKGISLRYDINSTSGHNHIAFIDAENDVQRLEKFFLDILSEMASTISESDETFYDEARKAYKNANSLYESIIKNRIWNVSKCLPTFDDREKILGVIQDVNNSWIHNVKCPDTLSESIKNALSKFYKEPYGVILAEVLGIPKNEIEKMIADIKNVEQSPEYKVKERLEKRKQLAKDTIFKYVERAITDILVKKGELNPAYTKWFTCLKDKMADRALSYVRTTDVVQQMEDVKTVVWRCFMKEGRLSFISNDENLWLNEFINILDEGGNDFAALHDSIVAFKDYKFDLEGAISKIIDTSIGDIATRFTIIQGAGGNIDSMRNAVYETLLLAESETKAAIQSECANVVESQLSIQLGNFNKAVIDFLTLIIPAKKNVLEYDFVLEQLIKFYNKYSTDIFSNDEQASQKLAVQEWNVLKLKYSVN